ncbi:MAG: glutamate dehydrogenase, partial [Spirochaetaceae bacterium]
SAGFIHDPDGISAEKLKFVMELKNVRRGRIKEYADEFKVKYVDGQRPWSIPCDAAFPSATQNEIDGADAKVLVSNGCKVVSEGANMPTNADGVKIFLDAGILYGPGKAANAGGVATSALEMSQNAIRLAWSREEVDGKLRGIMRDIHSAAAQAAEQYSTKGNYVAGANIAGFLKVADAMLEQGLV